MLENYRCGKCKKITGMVNVRKLGMVNVRKL